MKYCLWVQVRLNGEWGERIIDSTSNATKRTVIESADVENKTHYNSHRPGGSLGQTTRDCVIW